jgi:hypothetical protein
LGKIPENEAAEKYSLFLRKQKPACGLYLS